MRIVCPGEARRPGCLAVSHSVNSDTIQAKSAPERDAARHSSRMHESATRYERIGPRPPACVQPANGFPKSVAANRHCRPAKSVRNAGALIMPAVRTPMTSHVCASVVIRLLERIIISLLLIVLGITATLNQDRTPIDHNGLAGAESFLHQKQIGLCNVMSLADSSHRQTLAHAFIELLPFC
jgi:hypothetical protein